MDKLLFIKSKILENNSLEKLLHFWRFKNKTIVFTNGCFDIIHRGHVEYLGKAANEGDVLVVGLNSDASVRTIKGPNRPLQDEYSRALVLASFSFVSAVVIFNGQTPYDLINFIKPDILVKGGDYKTEDIAGSDIVLANGGKVMIINYIEGYSTTNIINRFL